MRVTFPVAFNSSPSSPGDEVAIRTGAHQLTIVFSRVRGAHFIYVFPQFLLFQFDLQETENILDAEVVTAL